MGTLHLVLILGGLHRVDSSHPPAAPDPEEAADQAEDHYRAGTTGLSAADEDEVARFSEIAGTLVLAGVKATLAWDTANAWLAENPTGYPEWVTLRPPGSEQRKTMPPPRLLELVSTAPPKLRKCLFCGEHKSFPSDFARASGDSGQRVSAQKCNVCFGTMPGNYAKPRFKPDPPEAGPRMCRFCAKVKNYPDDFRYPGKPHQVSARKCTSCSEKGTGVELERALEAQNEDEEAEAEEPAPPPRAVTKPAPPPPELAAAVDRFAAVRAAEPPKPTKRDDRVPMGDGFAYKKVETKPAPRQETAMSEQTAREAITKFLRNGDATAKTIQEATGLPHGTVASTLVKMRDDRSATKADGYGQPWALTAKGSGGKKTNGNGNGHHKASGNESDETPTSIPEPPGPLTDSPLVRMLLEERRNLVAKTAASVATIDELLNTYKVAKTAS